MSLYVTNNNSRRTKRARVENTRKDLTSGAVGSSFGTLIENQSDTKLIGRKPSIVTTEIGSVNSKALLIVGGAAGTDFNVGGDDRSLIFGADNTFDPAFPIQFSGPGHLAFEQEIEIPFIRGNLHISGDVKIDGNLNWENAGLLGAEPFAPAIEDALGNTLDGIFSEGAIYVNQTLLDYFEVKISWTGISSLVPGEALRLVGFPRSDYSIDSSPQMEGEGGVFTEEVNGHFNVQPVAGESYMELQETSYFSGGPPTPLTVANLASSGVVHFAGWMRKAA